jgi:hypothetical protein
MPRYRITIPDGSSNPQVVTINGVSIATENGFVPNSTLCLYAIAADGSGVFSRQPLKLLEGIVSATVNPYPGVPSQWCKFRGVYTLPDGRSFPYDTGGFWNYFCGSTYFVACGNGSPVCNLLITDSQGAVTRVDGVPGFGCPTVETLPDIDCQANEIECDDLGSPQGFCCIPCDSLNSKIRALI